ncbi:MAG TPA: ABC transporter permease [bacterium]|nr:ABC transporter permease [bacterium]
MRRLLRAVRRAHRTWVSALGALLLAGAVLAALAGPLAAPASPTAIAIQDRLRAPDAGHWFGTDQFGRDVLARALWGSRYSLGASFTAVLIATAAGSLLGIVSAYAGGWTDRVIMRICDVVLAFPALLLAIGVAAVLGAGIKSIVLALALVYTPRIARVMRGAALPVRQMEYMDAARSGGAGAARIIVRHLFPNCLPALIVQGSISFSQMLLAEAALSFLGLGAPPPTPTWGGMLAEGKDFLTTAPWVAIFPGLCISASVLGLNLVGDTLRDTLDPHQS